MTFGLPCITAVSDKATRKSSAQVRPLAMATLRVEIRDLLTSINAAQSK
jgi:hypothetical protein